MNWANELKVAMIEKNFNKIFELSSNLPEFKTMEDMLEAKDLIIQSLDILKNEQNSIKRNMVSLTKAKKFISNDVNLRFRCDKSI